MIASFLICTNTFNEQTRIAIRSCLNQITKFSFEIVVIVNGIDRQLIYNKLNDEFGDSIILFQSNLHGLPKNLNLGLARCRGEFILRFDADDICLSSRLEKQVNAMIENPEAGISFGNALLIDEEGKEIGHFLSYRPDSIFFLIFSNRINHPTVCFKKKLIEELGGYSEVVACEDYELWCRLFFLYGAAFLKIEDDLILYRNFSDNGFRRSPSAYWNSFIFKMKIVRKTFNCLLLFGALFSLFQFLYYYISACIFALRFVFKN